ncbi:hypothetical protein TWF694_003124 [Orbilia ellipsospora]|uniref:F-box domain-containing protein n=1 Tax=Orbilia ellipsospora TaxID=2528407 RepID=A0AAV9X1X9_9PEZI
MAARRRATLERLPLDVKIHILHAVNDLWTFQSICRASPSFSSIITLNLTSLNAILNQLWFEDVMRVDDAVWVCHASNTYRCPRAFGPGKFLLLRHYIENREKNKIYYEERDWAKYTDSWLEDIDINDDIAVPPTTQELMVVNHKYAYFIASEFIRYGFHRNSRFFEGREEEARSIVSRAWEEERVATFREHDRVLKAFYAVSVFMIFHWDHDIRSKGWIGVKGIFDHWGFRKSMEMLEMLQWLETRIGDTIDRALDAQKLDLLGSSTIFWPYLRQWHPVYHYIPSRSPYSPQQAAGKACFSKDIKAVLTGGPWYRIPRNPRAAEPISIWEAERRPTDELYKLRLVKPGCERYYVPWTKEQLRRIRGWNAEWFEKRQWEYIGDRDLLCPYTSPVDLHALFWDDWRLEAWGYQYPKILRLEGLGLGSRLDLDSDDEEDLGTHFMLMFIAEEMKEQARGARIPEDANLEDYDFNSDGVFFRRESVNVSEESQIRVPVGPTSEEGTSAAIGEGTNAGLDEESNAEVEEGASVEVKEETNTEVEEER